MFTLGLIGNNLDIQTFFSSLAAKQEKMVSGLLITGDTYDECSAKLKKTALSNIEDFSGSADVLLFLSESEQNFELATEGLKLAKDIILARYTLLDLNKIERLEKLSKEAGRNFLLLPNSDLLQGRLNSENNHTFYVHRERHLVDLNESTLLPIVYTDLLRLHDLSAHAIDRIKIVAGPKLMNEDSPIALSVTFTNGLHCSLLYSRSSKRNLFILYHENKVVNLEEPIQRLNDTHYNSLHANLVTEILRNPPVVSGLYDTSLIKQALLAVKEMIK